MIALVFLATVINYLDRQTLSVAAPVLREQFHMSNQDYSRVVFAFLLAYTISNGFSGGILDSSGDAPRLRAVHRCLVRSGNAGRGGDRVPFPGRHPLPAGHRRSRKPAGRRESGGGVVSRTGAGAGVRN